MSRVEVETLAFGGLSIAHDDRVLRPRRWTLHQSHWALELLAGLPDGPVLELCSGAGQIGLVVAAGTTRRLVCVDVDPAAAHYTLHNASTAGLADRVEMRVQSLTDAVGADETFPLILADPPWVPRADVGRFPEDPVRAIDGGPGGGLDVARDCVRVVGRHLTAEGLSLLQLGSSAQVDGLRDDLEAAGLRVVETRTYGARGVLILLSPQMHPSGVSICPGSGVNIRTTPRERGRTIATTEDSAPPAHAASGARPCPDGVEAVPSAQRRPSPRRTGARRSSMSPPG